MFGCERASEEKERRKEGRKCGPGDLRFSSPKVAPKAWRRPFGGPHEQLSLAKRCCRSGAAWRGARALEQRAPSSGLIYSFIHPSILTASLPVVLPAHWPAGRTCFQTRSSPPIASSRSDSRRFVVLGAWPLAHRTAPINLGPGGRAGARVSPERPARIGDGLPPVGCRRGTPTFG